MFSRLQRRRSNLQNLGRLSRSCPAVDSPAQDESSGSESWGSAASLSDPFAESGEEVAPPVSKSEKQLARQSLRRAKQREVEQKRNMEQNKISMDDYLGKQAQFRLWLLEEQKKQAKDLSSPKRKTYFKMFVRLWNKRHLPAKFYELRPSWHIEGDPPVPSEKQSPVYPAHPDRPRFRLLHNSPFLDPSIFPHTIDLSSDSINPGSPSPFSTFGKSTPSDNRTTVRFGGDDGDKGSVSPHPTSQGSAVRHRPQTVFRFGENKENDTHFSLPVTAGEKLHTATISPFKKMMSACQGRSLDRVMVSWSPCGQPKLNAVASPRCPSPFLTEHTSTSPLLTQHPNTSTEKLSVYREVCVAPTNQLYHEVKDVIDCGGSPPYTDLGSPTYTDIPFADPQDITAVQLQGTSSKGRGHRRRSHSLDEKPVYAVPSKQIRERAWPEHRAMSEEDVTVSPPPIPPKRFDPHVEGLGIPFSPTTPMPTPHTPQPPVDGKEGLEANSENESTKKSSKPFKGRLAWFGKKLTSRRRSRSCEVLSPSAQSAAEMSPQSPAQQTAVSQFPLVQLDCSPPLPRRALTRPRPPPGTRTVGSKNKTDLMKGSASSVSQAGRQTVDSKNKTDLMKASLSSVSQADTLTDSTQRRKFNVMNCSPSHLSQAGRQAHTTQNKTDMVNCSASQADRQTDTTYRSKFNPTDHSQSLMSQVDIQANVRKFQNQLDLMVKHTSSSTSCIDNQADATQCQKLKFELTEYSSSPWRLGAGARFSRLDEVKKLPSFRRRSRSLEQVGSPGFDWRLESDTGQVVQSYISNQVAQSDNNHHMIQSNHKQRTQQVADSQDKQPTSTAVQCTSHQQPPASPSAVVAASDHTSICDTPCPARCELYEQVKSDVHSELSSLVQKLSAGNISQPHNDNTTPMTVRELQSSPKRMGQKQNSWKTPTTQKVDLLDTGSENALSLETVRFSPHVRDGDLTQTESQIVRPSPHVLDDDSTQSQCRPQEAAVPMETCASTSQEVALSDGTEHTVTSTSQDVAVNGETEHCEALTAVIKCTGSKEELSERESNEMTTSMEVTHSGQRIAATEEGEQSSVCPSLPAVVETSSDLKPGVDTSLPVDTSGSVCRDQGIGMAQPAAPRQHCDLPLETSSHTQVVRNPSLHTELAFSITLPTAHHVSARTLLTPAVRTRDPQRRRSRSVDETWSHRSFVPDTPLHPRVLQKQPTLPMETAYQQPAIAIKKTHRASVKMTCQQSAVIQKTEAPSLERTCKQPLIVLQKPKAPSLETVCEQSPTVIQKPGTAGGTGSKQPMAGREKVTQPAGESACIPPVPVTSTECNVIPTEHDNIIPTVTAIQHKFGSSVRQTPSRHRRRSRSVGDMTALEERDGGVQPGEGRGFASVRAFWDSLRGKTDRSGSSSVSLQRKPSTLRRLQQELSGAQSTGVDRDRGINNPQVIVTSQQFHPTKPSSGDREGFSECEPQVPVQLNKAKSISGNEKEVCSEPDKSSSSVHHARQPVSPAQHKMDKGRGSLRGLKGKKPSTNPHHQECVEAQNCPLTPDQKKTEPKAETTLPIHRSPFVTVRRQSSRTRSVVSPYVNGAQQGGADTNTPCQGHDQVTHTGTGEMFTHTSATVTVSHTPAEEQTSTSPSKGNGPTVGEDLKLKATATNLTSPVTNAMQTVHFASGGKKKPLPPPKPLPKPTIRLHTGAASQQQCPLSPAQDLSSKWTHMTAVPLNQSPVSITTHHVSETDMSSVSGAITRRKRCSEELDQTAVPEKLRSVDESGDRRGPVAWSAAHHHNTAGTDHFDIAQGTDTDRQREEETASTLTLAPAPVRSVQDQCVTLQGTDCSDRHRELEAAMTPRPVRSVKRRSTEDQDGSGPRPVKRRSNGKVKQQTPVCLARSSNGKKESSACAGTWRQKGGKEQDTDSPSVQRASSGREPRIRTQLTHDSKDTKTSSFAMRRQSSRKDSLRRTNEDMKAGSSAVRRQSSRKDSMSASNSVGRASGTRVTVARTDSSRQTSILNKAGQQSTLNKAGSTPGQQSTLNKAGSTPGQQPTLNKAESIPDHRRSSGRIKTHYAQSTSHGKSTSGSETPSKTRVNSPMRQSPGQHPDHFSPVQRVHSSREESKMSGTPRVVKRFHSLKETASNSSAKRRSGGGSGSTPVSKRSSLGKGKSRRESGKVKRTDSSRSTNTASRSGSFRKHGTKPPQSPTFIRITQRLGVSEDYDDSGEDSAVDQQHAHRMIDQQHPHSIMDQQHALKIITGLQKAQSHRAAEQGHCDTAMPVRKDQQFQLQPSAHHTAKADTNVMSPLVVSTSSDMIGASRKGRPEVDAGVMETDIDSWEETPFAEERGVHNITEFSTLV